LPVGPGLDSMIWCVLTRQCPRRNGPESNHRSISVLGEIPTHTSYRSICRRLVIPQTLLATHLKGKPLTVEHGAPLRLVAPVKLGLKNIKAITRITYTRDEPADYWARRGYSRYDGI
jgi:hypothetical protein